MPIWLRNFTFHEIQDYHTKQSTPPTTTNTLVTPDGKIDKSKFPKVSTSYKKP